VRGEIVARSYAEALFELGLRVDQLEEFGMALEQVARLLVEVPDLRRLLETPRVSGVQKKAMLREVFSGRIPEPVLNFLLLTLDRRRQRLIGVMNTSFQGLLDEHMGRAHVTVEVARPLDPMAEEELTARLSRVLGKTVVPHLRIRPELVGGVVFRSGDVVYDGSVRRRLDTMKRRLLAAEMSTD